MQSVWEKEDNKHIQVAYKILLENTYNLTSEQRTRLKAIKTVFDEIQVN